MRRLRHLSRRAEQSSSPPSIVGRNGRRCGAVLTDEEFACQVRTLFLYGGRGSGVVVPIEQAPIGNNSTDQRRDHLHCGVDGSIFCRSCQACTPSVMRS